MISPNIFYITLMNRNTGYRATWNPNVRLKIGMVGKIDKTGVFNVYSSLEKKGIPAEVMSDNAKVEMDYTSHDSVSITSKLAGSAPVAGSVLSNANAGFSVDFKSDNGVVFQTSGYTTHQLTNLAEIEAQVLNQYKSGGWEKDWLIITQLVEADSATIIISNSSNVHLDLQATANAGAPGLKLTDASLKLAVVREQGSSMKYLAESGLTPLYRVMGIRHPLFGLGKDSLKPKTGAEEGAAAGEESDSLRMQEFDADELTAE